MNILMVTNTYLPHVGGVARSVAAFTSEIRRRGHRVLIVAPEFENRPAEELDVVRVPAIQNFNGSDFSVRIPVPALLTAALAAFRPDIVHAHHSFLLGDTALRVAASYNVPLVFTHHTMYEQYTHYVPGEFAALARFAVDLTTGYANLCDAVVAPSESVAALLAQRGVVTPLEVIPTGVDIEHFSRGDGPGFRRQLGIPAAAFVVGHVGRLAPEKNLPFLAQAVAAFLHRHPQAHFLVVGAGPSEQAIRDCFRSSRLRGRLHMPGGCSGQRLVDAYHAMDVFAFASQSETQGMVLTEAMAASVPVVAVNAPGVREVVADRINGRLLPSQHPRSFAAALSWLADLEPTARDKLRQTARDTAKTFALPATASKMLDLYGRLTTHAARDKAAPDNAWETALRRMEAEWELWANLAQAARSTLASPHVFRVPVLGTALHGWQIIRQWCSRSEWGARLLGLPPNSARVEHGLILVQIDGLSQPRMEHALRRRRLPFLRRLLGEEGYRRHTLYSGLPSTTAAVQGELFYGVPTAVPAFGFADRTSGKLVDMLDWQTAVAVEQRISRGRLGLVDGGSAFCNAYTGGAAEPHLCAPALGWGRLLRYANPLKVLLFVCWNAWSLVRTCGLAALEVVLALIDCIRGSISGHDLVKELKFIPSRVGVCILFRELLTISAQMDAARGLPVIHVNFLGYDEQSHRRGPDSAFASWSLKGIDDAIRRIWQAARRSSRRDYTLWVFSDHGQERVVPYKKATGRWIEEAVHDVFRPYRAQDAGTNSDIVRNTQSQRIRYLGERAADRLLPREVRRRPAAQPGQLLVTGLGPIAHVYLPFPLPDGSLSEACRSLVREAGIPLVLVSNGRETARAWTPGGDFELPRDAAGVLGDGHPFLAEAAVDLVRLCRHPDAGDIVLCGWSRGQPALSFAFENGAHGGAGAQETCAFALLPSDTPLPQSPGDYVRPADLRQAGLELLGRGDTLCRPRRRRVPRSTLRLATYNVHSCVGLDGKHSAARIARVLAQCEADVIALQELDVRRARSRNVDQAHEIARLLEMEFHFHPAYAVEEERFGDAILSRHPMRLMRAAALPGLDHRRGLEPRGALWVAIEVAGGEIQVVNTHLGLLEAERLRQAEALLGPDWLSAPDCRGPAILCGDFNAFPRTKTYRRLTAHLHDVQAVLEGNRPKKTWFSRFPLGRIDHVFIGPEMEVVRVEIPSTSLARVASDHLPLVVDLRARSVEASDCKEASPMAYDRPARQPLRQAT